MNERLTPPMTGGRSWLVGGCLAWAVLGFGVAVGSLGGVNADARVVVAVASVVFPFAAATGALAVHQGRLRSAGVLLIVSAATPTYFFWAPNIAALVMGVTLLVGSRNRSRHIQEALGEVGGLRRSVGEPGQHGVVVDGVGHQV